MEDIFNIAGKSIVITGGAGVLGSEMARQFAHRGARVCIVDYDVMRANKVCKEIEAEGHIALTVQADVLDEKELVEAFTCTVETFGKVDVLINAAGGNKKEATCSPPTTFFDLPVEALRGVFDLNCLGTMLASQVFGRDMARRGEGVIINIASMNAVRPLTNIAAYSAAKAAVANFTQWLATYMAQRHSPDIRVNAVAPGFFLTEQNRFLLIDETTGEMTPRGQAILDHTPQQRLGEPVDLMGTMLWLMSDASKFVTGIVVPVDGGFSAYSGV
ncbi:SDR family oxidoreductase [Planctomycetota bacterium]